MNIEAPSEQLIHKILAVVVSQILPRVNHSVHISLHEVCDDVDVFVVGLGGWLLDVDQSNNILMIKEFYIEKENKYLGNLTNASNK